MIFISYLISFCSCLVLHLGTSENFCKKTIKGNISKKVRIGSSKLMNVTEVKKLCILTKLRVSKQMKNKSTLQNNVIELG